MSAAWTVRGIPRQTVGGMPVFPARAMLEIFVDFCRSDVQDHFGSESTGEVSRLISQHDAYASDCSRTITPCWGQSETPVSLVEMTR